MKVQVVMLNVLLFSAVALAEGGGYDLLRKELRSFYPDECHGCCKAPAFASSYQHIAADMDAFVAAHPKLGSYDALDAYHELLKSMRRHFVPFLFDASPFYFEAGVNGGWAEQWTPGRLLKKHAICGKFSIQQDHVSMDDWERYSALRRERFLTCGGGSFADPAHHIPPCETVFSKGFGGVWKDVQAALAACPDDDPYGRRQLEAELDGLKTVHELQLAFAHEARRRLEEQGLTPMCRRNFERIAESAARCPWEPPRTFYEGLNTLWFVREILSYVDGLGIFSLGRPDAWLMGLYRADLAAGRLTREEAKDLVARFMIHADCHHDGMIPVRSYGDHEMEIPVTLGGCDAAGRPVWNELTEMFLDGHLENDLVFPKLHVRYSASSPSAYLRKIGEMLLGGHAVFALFNDDRHIPQFVGMGYPPERARDYIGCGCWDGNVDSWTDTDTGNYFSVIRVLEAMIYRDPAFESETGIVLDPIENVRTFEELRDAVYRNFIRIFLRQLSDYTRCGRGLSKMTPHPAYTACLKGGVESRRDVTAGGVFRAPRVVTLAFLANTVDSLLSIKKVCFDDRQATLPEFLDAVRSNWAGDKGERLRALAMAAPYWGDNSAASNELMRWWIDSVSREIRYLTNDRGGPYVLATWVYREFLFWGEKTRATPDGRHDGDKLAQGFAPSEFRCEASASTVLNAIGSLDHTRLYASNANLTFEKADMTPELFEAIFRVVAKKDMHLLQPNCLSIEDLLDAQIHPERHRNIIVKVCGFSARFIALSKQWQDEVISRHRLRSKGGK